MGNQNGGVFISEDISIPNPAGLHARPAAVFASKAKTFSADIKLIFGARSANAKSVVGIMGLGTSKADVVSVQANGADAEAAVKELAELLKNACGETEHDAPAAPKAAPAAPVVQHGANVIAGVGASPGLAIGQVHQHRVQQFQLVETAGSQQEEKTKLSAALKQAASEIETLKSGGVDPARQAILTVHQDLLQDPDLLTATDHILAKGKSASWAWHGAFTALSTQLETQGNALLGERANDIRDIGRRVLAVLTGTRSAAPEVPAGAILIAEDLTPSDTASLDPAKVLGFCTRTGGGTSHVAILARALGIPAICGIDEAALALQDGETVIIDGMAGTLRVKPDEATLQATKAEITRLAERRAMDAANSQQDARLSDGTRIEVVANIRNAADARDAVVKGAEGVGLLRSEFLFDDRDTAPDENEQAREYCAVAEALGHERPLVVRTLDVGGDKPLSYLPLPKEDNPFLGLRGIRIGLDQPELLRTQLRAILRAAPLTRLHIMFPMIASLEELRTAKAMLAEEQAKAGITDVKVGIMVEVPSTVVLARHFAAEVDFFSIGTNDLTQYVLAMDRGHPKLAKQADALHPAVLTMIAMTCEGARAHGRWVGVCGGLASDERAAPVLVGMGVKELSVSVPALATVKATLARWSLVECQALAQEVLKQATTEEVRAVLAKNTR